MEGLEADHTVWPHADINYVLEESHRGPLNNIERGTLTKTVMVTYLIISVCDEASKQANYRLRTRDRPYKGQRADKPEQAVLV